MLGLFNLIQSLTKEEKRLFSIYGKPAPYQVIYQSYSKAPQFSKHLDTQIYQNHYAEYSKAYYSIQKKELYEDILNVLLIHSNSQNPVYQYYNIISKMGLLIERKFYQDALEFYLIFKEKIKEFPEGHQKLFYELVFTIYENLNKVSFIEFLEFLNENKQEWNTEKTILLKIKFLKMNVDELDIEKIRNFAVEIYQEIKSISQPSYQLQMAGVQSLLLSQNHEDAHKELTRIYMSHYKDILNDKNALDCLAILMSSCLKNGDFLLLNSILYKTESKLNSIPEELKQNFLLKYYENAALFHFYENELPTALKEIQFVIDNSNDTAYVEKCICYRMAMLVAGDLQYQLTKELHELSLKYPNILSNPYILICDILASINNQLPKNNIIQKIENLELIAKNLKLKNIIHISKMLYNFVNLKKTTDEEILVYPSDWEPILAVDLWIKAKVERAFYYNLLIEKWLKRRKVF